DDAVIDLRHLLREELRHKFGPGTREEDLRPARLAADIVNKRAHTVAIAHVLARNHLVPANYAFRAAKIHDDVAVFVALHGAVDDLADAILVFVVVALAFGLANLLYDDLLGILRGDATEIQRRKRLGDEVTDFGVLVAKLRVGQGDLG